MTIWQLSITKFKMYLLLNTAISFLGILPYQNTWPNAQEYTHSDVSCGIITDRASLKRSKIYVDKCHKLKDEETEAQTGAKTKEYHIHVLKRQFPRVPSLQFIPQS